MSSICKGNITGSDDIGKDNIIVKLFNLSLRISSGLSQVEGQLAPHPICPVCTSPHHGSETHGLVQERICIYQNRKARLVNICRHHLSKNILLILYLSPLTIIWVLFTSSIGKGNKLLASSDTSGKSNNIGFFRLHVPLNYNLSAIHVQYW